MIIVGKLKALYGQYFDRFLTSGHQRSIETRKNILYSFFIKGFSIVINLLLVTLTVNYINPTQYGIWLTLSSIIAWFSFFDIGLGNGLRNKFAVAKAEGKIAESQAYVSTTYAILTIIFASVWIIFILANFFIDWSLVLNAPSEIAGELSSLALIVVTFFCLQIVLKTILTILIADQKPAIATLCDTIGQLLSLIIIYILIKTTEGSLLLLGLGIGVAPIVILIFATFFFFRSKYKEFAPTLQGIQLSYGKDILNLGTKFFVIQIAVIVVYQTSNIIIAQVSGLEDVTRYNIAFKYFSIGTMLFGIIIAPFWSAFTEAFTLSDYNWMKKSIRKLYVVAFLLILAILVLLLFANYVYRIWVGDFIDIRFSISAMVALYIITNIWTSLHSQLLNGMGKIKLQLIVSVIVIFINIPLAIFLGQKFGIEGVVGSALLLNLIAAIYSPIQLSLLMNRKAKGIWNE